MRFSESLQYLQSQHVLGIWPFRQRWAHQLLNTREQSHSKRSISGPKSGHSRGLGHSGSFRFALLVFIAFYRMTTYLWSGGEGGDLATEITEAFPDWEQALILGSGAKQRGFQPLSGYGRNRSSEDTVIQKRSLKRAFRRAQRDGSSWYRGRCMTLSDFSFMGQTMERPAPEPAPARTGGHARDLHACNSRHQNRRFLRYLHWNGGGLSSPKLDELKTWALLQNLDVLVLTETRWKWNNEWMDAHWLHVHIGSLEDSSAGILILISRTLCTPDKVRWLDVVPGRLLHLQLRLKPRPFDILAGYQHAMSHATPKMKLRHTWWQALDKYLGHLPKRNVLLLIGDFNCRLPQSHGIVGPEVFRWQGALTTGATHADESEFLALVRAHGLSALATWQPLQGPSYHHGSACSRIDHCFTRLTMADGVAKDVKILQNAPFLGSLQHGHFPLLGQLRKFWFPPKNDGFSAGISPHQRAAGHTAFTAQSAEWQQFLQLSGLRLTQFLDQADPQDADFIPHMHRIASDTFVEFFQDNRSRPRALHACSIMIMP